MSKRVLLLVSNDIHTDQRVDKTCKTLLAQGFQVTVLGRMRAKSKPISREYQVERLKLLFDKGPLFYLELNLRFFFRLMKKDWDIVHVNDLDTLLAGYIAYINLKDKELVYDSHEYFTEVPELQGRFAKAVWLFLEETIFPKLKHVYTVSASIAKVYKAKYNVEVGLVRNVPPYIAWKKEGSRTSLGLPEGKRILILQGAGINVSRGAEEAVLAMKELSEDYVLLLLGGGDVFEKLKSLVKLYRLQERVIFKERMPFEELMQHTLHADMGLTLDKGDNLNYEYALPNKLFDYIAAGIPVLSGPTIEAREMIKEYQIGKSVEEITPQAIAQTIELMFSDPTQVDVWKQNTIAAYKILNWEKESQGIIDIYKDLG